MENDRIKKLPKWAQKLISEKDHRIEQLASKITNTEKVSYIINNTNWYTLGEFTTERRALFIIDKDAPRKICSIGAGSVLMIGYKQKVSDGIIEEE